MAIIQSDISEVQEYTDGISSIKQYLLETKSTISFSQDTNINVQTSMKDCMTKSLLLTLNYCNLLERDLENVEMIAKYFEDQDKSTFQE